MGKKNRVMFVCNDGGHFSQMMVLKSLFSDYKSIFLTDNIRAEKLLNEEAPNCEVVIIRANRKQLNLTKRKKTNRFMYLHYYFALIVGCVKALFKYKPKVIISTGSNLAVITFFLGKLFGSKLIFIETRAKVKSKTLTGKIISPICDRIYVQWPEMLEVYPQSIYCGVLI